jgi:hypothetical protein
MQMFTAVAAVTHERTSTMHATRSSSFLRQVLTIDAVVSGTTGLAMIALAGPLEALLGVPATLLRYAGISLVPFVAVVAWLATRERVARPAVWAVIALNVMWTVDSLLLLVTGWIAPTVLGYTFIVGQALIVAAFAEMQYMGLQRSRADTAAA